MYCKKILDGRGRAELGVLKSRTVSSTAQRYLTPKVCLDYLLITFKSNICTRHQAIVVAFGSASCTYNNMIFLREKTE